MKRNTGTYWSAGELRKLEALWKRYKNMEAVAEILERTPGGAALINGDQFGRGA